jgi:hypothetical protein
MDIDIQEQMREVLRQSLSEGGYEGKDLDEATDKAMEPIESFLNEMKGAAHVEADYEEARELGQPEVQEAVERYLAIPQEQRSEHVLLWWLLGSGTPPYKMSQEQAEYADGAGTVEQACLNCDFFYQKVPTGEYVCSQMRGPIEPGGWCNQWKLASVLEKD